MYRYTYGCPLRGNTLLGAFMLETSFSSNENAPNLTFSAYVDTDWVGHCDVDVVGFMCVLE